MKTKRITMYIELLLFLFGTGLAIYFGIIDEFDLKISSLISNICIGISTGGLVAFLVAIPSYLTDSKSIKSYLFENARLLYVYTYQLAYLMDDAVAHPYARVSEKICEHNLTEIVGQSTKLITVDASSFICKTKEKQINIVKNELYDVVLKQMPSINKLHLAIIQTKLNINLGKLPQQEVTFSMLSKELMNVKSEAIQILNLIDTTIKMISNKKEFINWNMNIEAIKKTLEETSLFTD